MASIQKVREILLSMINLPNAPELSGPSAANLIKQYHEVLGHWPDELLDSAALHYKSTETFFPTPGTLNNKVLDLQMLAMGVPTAGEAWSQVLTAGRFVDSIWCDEGWKLYKNVDGKTGRDYWNALNLYNSHRDGCDKCVQGGYREIYSHPVVAETVRLLGGRDCLMTDNPAADRKQFIDAYRERVEKEGRKFIMPPKIQEHIKLSTGKIRDFLPDPDHKDYTDI